MTEQSVKSTKITAYKLSRRDRPGWVFAGTSPRQAAQTLRHELEEDLVMPPDEVDPIIIEAYETTQEEIDALPEFEGW